MSKKDQITSPEKKPPYVAKVALHDELSRSEIRQERCDLGKFTARHYPEC
jgi:hypothetical protein